MTDATFLLTVGSFPLTVGRFYLQWCLGASLRLSIGASLLAIGAFLLTVEALYF